LDGLGAFRDGAFAFLTNESGDSIFAGLEKLFGEGAADTTVDLSRLSGKAESIKRLTYANNGNFINGSRGCHNGDS